MEYLIKASAITILFYMFYKILLQRETFFVSNRYFLLIGLIATVLIPLIYIPIYTNQLPIETVKLELTNTVQTSKEAFTVNWLQILSFIYYAGILILSSKLIINFSSLNNLITSATKKKIDSLYFIETEKNTPPFSFFNYIVYNPKQFKKEELTQVITHEKTHVKQLHSIDVLLAELFTILFWFNPISWLYKKEIQQNLEFIADDLAHQKAPSKKQYQELLLKTSISKNQLALTNNFYNSLIKKRIIMLHKNRSKSTNKWKYAFITPLLIAFVFTFNTKVIAQNSKVIHILGEDETISYQITKESTTADFDKITKELSKTGVTAKFNKIKRTKKGDISAINITIASKNATSKYNVSSNTEPIEPIVITIKNNGESIKIGKQKEKRIIITENGKNHIIKNENNTEIIMITEDNNEETKTSSTIVTIKNNDDDKNLIISNTESENILYFIDGNKASKKDISKLDANLIDNINVIKGDKAIEKYGKDAKDGVIIITTKKEK